MDLYQKIRTKKWDYKVAVRDLPVQTSSLTKLIVQLQGEGYELNLSDKEIKEKISDDLKDLLSLILFISHKLSIDLNQDWTVSDHQEIESRNLNPNKTSQQPFLQTVISAP